MNKTLLYKKAYKILEYSTPLKFDCGKLCNKKCCSGDKNTGMHLYPGEEETLPVAQEFLSLNTELFYNKEIFFAVCQGKCARSFRPLACRIYPLIPYFDGNGKLEIIKDPRAKYICPLLMDFEEIKIDKRFKRKVRKLFQLLTQDIEIRNYVYSLSSVAEEYSKFTSKI